MASKKSRRMRLWVMGSCLLVAILGAWEMVRRSRIVSVSAVSLLAVVPAEPAVGETIDPALLDQQFRDPVQLMKLVDMVRENFRQLGQREVELDHTVKTIVREMNSKLAQPPAEQTLERVTFRGGKKYRQTIEWTDLATGKPKKGVTKKVREDVNKIEEIFPFNREADTEGYRYQFAGMEKVGENWTIRIDFAPADSPVKRFAGQAWIDARTTLPIRVFCRLAEKRPFLDQFSMLLEYGSVETGDWQLVRSVIDGSGGFAMIQKHYRSEVELSEYAPSPSPTIRSETK
ncbi:MAG: hypothetical protein K2X29_05580 [Candidatus Obscuribacterales bacterium]|nr:hypothetical protein [Candidatus Obscuribacterales bacterium]